MPFNKSSIGSKLRELSKTGVFEVGFDSPKGFDPVFVGKSDGTKLKKYLNDILTKPPHDKIGKMLKQASRDPSCMVRVKPLPEGERMDREYEVAKRKDRPIWNRKYER